MRMARIGDVVLLDHPADATEPRCINAYLVEVQDFAGINFLLFRTPENGRWGDASSRAPRGPG
jgi:hypothetical protein